MTHEQSETLNHAIGKFMALGFLNPADVDVQLTEASLPVKEMIDKLNRALKQAMERAKFIHEANASSGQVFQSNFELMQPLVVFEERSPDLAAWLKENQ